MERGHLISFGLGGHSIELVTADGNKATLSGYEDPDSFVRRLAGGDYKGCDLEEAPVLDKRGILKVKPGLAITMPMPDPKLPPGGSIAFSVHKGTFDMMLGPGGLKGGFRDLALLAKRKFSGLDYVAIDVYVQLWRDKGARVGTLRKGVVVWEK